MFSQKFICSFSCISRTNYNFWELNPSVNLIDYYSSFFRIFGNHLRTLICTHPPELDILDLSVKFDFGGSTFAIPIVPLIVLVRPILIYMNTPTYKLKSKNINLEVLEA